MVCIGFKVPMVIKAIYTLAANRGAGMDCAE